MIATIADRPALGIKDFKGRTDPDWCPGCGDFGVLHALKQAIAELGQPLRGMRTRAARVRPAQRAT